MLRFNHTLRINPAINSVAVIATVQISACTNNDISHGNSAPHRSRGTARIIASTSIVHDILSGWPPAVFQMTSARKYIVPVKHHSSTERTGLLYRVIVHNDGVQLVQRGSGVHGDFLRLLVFDQRLDAILNGNCQR